jgi:predicted PurR-regulated permease PerM
MGDDNRESRAFVERSVEAAIRIALIALLAAWCFHIVGPFIVPSLWGMIIAIALYPGYSRLAVALNGQRVAAAVILALTLLTVLLVPASLLGASLVEMAHGLVRGVEEGTLEIPPPPEWAPGLPFFGTALADVWGEAATDLESALVPFAPQVKAFLRWLLELAAGVGLGLLQFVFAVAIAAVLLAQSSGAAAAAHAVAQRLAGARGLEFAQLAEATIRSVTRGILGVALIQSLLAGLGWLAVGIPGAGFWALLALVLATVQVGIFPITVPTVIYVFYHADTPTFVIFLIWMVFVSSIDNILKPLFLGRGVKVPMAVVFIGAIGGLLSSGIIGLFVGAVVLVLGYKLFLAWLGGVRETPPPAGADTAVSVQSEAHSRRE